VGAVAGVLRCEGLGYDRPYPMIREFFMDYNETIPTL
jgi:hypothetical protein